MKLKMIAFFMCLLMLFTLPSYAATKKKVVPPKKPPLEFSWAIPDPASKSQFPPLVQTSIKINSIGTPELKLVAVNTSKKTITAFEFQTSFKDAFGRPVYRMGTKNKTFTGIVQRTWIAPESTKYPGKVFTFNLVLYKLANSVLMDKYQNRVVTVTLVKFSDGSIWRK